MKTAPRPVTPVLTIDITKHPPTYIAIGGATYLLRRRADLDLHHLMRLDRLKGELAPLQGKADPTDQDLAVLSDLVGRLCAIIVAAPDSVLASLSDADRLQILHQFTIMTGVSLVAPRTATKKKRRIRR